MSNNWHANHGSLTPGTWSIKCDVTNCPACLAPPMQPTADAEARHYVRVCAEANGWYVAQDKLHANKSWDLCPEHAPPIAPSGRMR